MPPKHSFIGSLDLTRTRALFIAACIGLVSLGVVAAWFISADPSSTVPGLEPFFRFMLSPWMLATHFIAVAFMAFGFWFLRSQARDPSAASAVALESRQYGRLLTLVFVLFATSLSIVGYLFIDDLRVTFRAQRFAELEGIASLKAQQVDKWILNHSIDTQNLAQSLRALPLDRLSSDRETRQIVRVLFGESLASNADRSALALFDVGGSALIDVGGTAGAVAELRTYVRTLKASDRGLRIVDLHLQAGSPATLAMDFVLSIAPGVAGEPATVLVLTADPGRELFWQITAWPAVSPGSEVLVVRRNEENLQLLTPPTLLDETPAPLTFTLPLSRGELPGVQALRQGDGAREGVDYRGKAVYSASHHVTGAPWQVIAKTDVAEALLPWREKGGMVAAVIGAAILAAAFMVITLWQGQRAGFLAFRAAQIEEHAAIAKHFEGLVRLARDPVFLIDPDGKFVDCNEAAVAAYGYGAEEFRSLTVTDIRAPETRAEIQQQYLAAEQPGGVLFETTHRRKDGTVFPVEVSSRAIEVDGVLYRQSFVRDISRRRELEGEVHRLARVQKALRAANSILLRAGSEQALFQGMCDAIVHMGGYHLAFVGVANQDAVRSVGFLAIAGAAVDHVRAAGISWGEGPTGRGPTGMALKTGKIQVQQDFAHNPGVARWRDQLLAESYRSGISLPLKVSGAVVATLTIYSSLANAFTAEEVDLLTEFAADLSYGLGALRGVPGN
jgi:PAS domain S-box-containing protein